MAKRVQATAKQKAKEKATNVVITQGLVLEWGRKLADKQRLVDEAKVAVKNVEKAAKKEGIDVKALQLALKARKRDPDEVALRVKTELRYLQWLGLPLGTQVDLFGAPPAAVNDDGLTARERAAQADWEAGEAGYRAGRSGQARDDNPHVAGSSAHAMWDKSYLAGQAAIAAEMGDSAEVAAPGKRKKGGNPEDGRTIN